MIFYKIPDVFNSQGKLPEQGVYINPSPPRPAKTDPARQFYGHRSKRKLCRAQNVIV